MEYQSNPYHHGVYLHSDSRPRGRNLQWEIVWCLPADKERIDLCLQGWDYKLWPFLSFSECWNSPTRYIHKTVNWTRVYNLFYTLGENFFELDKTSVMPGYPKLIKDVWGISGPIDAAFTRINCEGKSYIFKVYSIMRYDIYNTVQIYQGFGDSKSNFIYKSTFKDNRGCTKHQITSR